MAPAPSVYSLDSRALGVVPHEGHRLLTGSFRIVRQIPLEEFGALCTGTLRYSLPGTKVEEVYRSGYLERWSQIWQREDGSQKAELRGVVGNTSSYTSAYPNRQLCCRYRSVDDEIEEGLELWHPNGRKAMEILLEGGCLQESSVDGIRMDSCERNWLSISIGLPGNTPSGIPMEGSPPGLSIEMAAERVTGLSILKKESRLIAYLTVAVDSFLLAEKRRRIKRRALADFLSSNPWCRRTKSNSESCSLIRRYLTAKSRISVSDDN